MLHTVPVFPGRDTLLGDLLNLAFAGLKQHLGFSEALLMAFKLFLELALFDNQKVFDMFSRKRLRDV